MSALEEPTLTEAEMKVALLRKLHAATKDIEAIEKASENTFHHYRYAGIEGSSTAPATTSSPTT
jgi:DNA-binding CsgD family transcriptional regulator